MKRVMFSLICLSLLSMVAQGGPVAHWTMDGDVGTAATAITDVVGPSDGVIANAGALGAAWATGFNGQGASLQLLDPAQHRKAGSAYVRTAYGVSIANSDFTFAAWIKPTDAALARQTVFSINPTGGTYSATTGARSYIIEVKNKNLNVNNYVSGQGITTTGNLIESGEWTHIAITGTIDSVDTTKVNLVYYIDGIDRGTCQMNAVDLTNGYGYTLGAYAYAADSSPTGYNYSYSGGLDDVRLYKEALTAEQVAYLAIPEPATIAILGLGALLGLRRKR
jgi:hypothetical protein